MTERLTCCGLCLEYSELLGRVDSGMCWMKADYVHCMDYEPECFKPGNYVGEYALSCIARTLKPKTVQELIDLISWRDAE